MNTRRCSFWMMRGSWRIILRMSAATALAFPTSSTRSPVPRRGFPSHRTCTLLGCPDSRRSTKKNYKTAAHDEGMAPSSPFSSGGGAPMNS